MSGQRSDVFDLENGALCAIPPCVLHFGDWIVIRVVSIVTESGDGVLEDGILVALLLTAVAVRIVVVMCKDAPLGISATMDSGCMAMAGLRVQGIQAITIVGYLLFGIGGPWLMLDASGPQPELVPLRFRIQLEDPFAKSSPLA